MSEYAPGSLYAAAPGMITPGNPVGNSISISRVETVLPCSIFTWTMSGVEFHVLPDHRENFLAELGNEIGLGALDSLMREQNLKPFACDRRGTASLEEAELHAALRANSLLSSRLFMLGTIIETFSPFKRLAASM